jgi:GxxExxY protein
MPVKCAASSSMIGQEEFHEIDHIVMGQVFAMHNSMGRFLDERIYQDELAHRCANLGLEAMREVEVRVKHRDFQKSYFLDLLVGGGCLYELKTAASLMSKHDREVIHYLLLTGLHHGKLVNLLPPSVESRFISTRLTHKDRKTWTLDDRGWQPCGETGVSLRGLLFGLLDDLGLFLDAALYQEALVHLTQASGGGIQPVPIIAGGRVAGIQNLCLLNPECAWHLSANRENLDSYEIHIARLFSNTPLRSMHWINLNQRHVTIKTLTQ